MMTPLQLARPVGGLAHGLERVWNFRERSRSFLLDRAKGGVGTLVNAPVPTESGQLFASASSQYALTDYYPGAFGPLTLAVRFRTTATGSQQAGLLCMRIGGSGNYQQIVLIISSNAYFGGSGQVVASDNSGSQGSSQSASRILNGTRVVTDGKWHTVVLVRAQAQSTNYVDGVADSTSSVALPTHARTTERFSIGALMDGDTPVSGWYFNGTIDFAAIWTRALDVSEVAALNVDPLAMFNLPNRNLLL